MYTVYLIQSDESSYKIGITKRDPKKRLKELSTGNSNDLTLISSFESKWGTKIESQLHRKYSYQKKRGEWFELNEEDVRNFKDECMKIHEMMEYMAKENYWFQKENEKILNRPL